MINEEVELLNTELELETSIYCRLKHPISHRIVCVATEQGRTEQETRQLIEKEVKAGYNIVCMEEEIIDLHESANFVLLFEAVMKVGIDNHCEMVFTSNDPRNELIWNLAYKLGKVPNMFNDLKTYLKGANWQTKFSS